MPQSGNQIGHLHSGQLPALARLRALRDLDLELVATVEILRRHAETAARDLLDPRGRIVPVRVGREMRRIFSAFSGVRFRSDPVHGNVQGLVSFGTQCPERHARRHESFADLGYRFHFVDMHRLRSRFDVQKVAHMDRQSRLQFRGILFP